jgi:hypothetical protein
MAQAWENSSPDMEGRATMAVPKVIGTEIEYGVIVPNDPYFDPISVSLLLVNSYHGDPQRRLLWDYDQEEPFMDARSADAVGAAENDGRRSLAPSGFDRTRPAVADGGRRGWLPCAGGGQAISSRRGLSRRPACGAADQAHR